PWVHGIGQPPTYQPNFSALEGLLSVPVRAGASSESGLFPKGIDLWLSYELRRAGFADYETWPRAQRPRVLPRELAVLLEHLPARLPGFPGLKFRDEVAKRIADLPAVTPTEAVVLGRAYDKQVDVCIARWERGPELLISTKAQLSSFGKNLPNRFEEAYGDAANLRARYPLTAVGYVFVQRATILRDEPDAFERTIDMMRKLRDEGDGTGYTATGLVLVDWDHTQGEPAVTVVETVVPEDLAVDKLLARLIQQVLRATPVAQHVQVREQYERRALAVGEAEPSDMA
ncbi:MAG: hypothetical protein ACRDVZ_11685, partial [Jiangellaceae bacterium]